MKINLLIVKGEFSLADFLEREAGHLAISMTAILFAAVAWHFGWPGWEALAGAAAGWLGRSMGSK